MGTRISFEPVCASRGAAEFVASFISTLQPVIDALAAEVGMAAPDSLTVVLADHFNDEVTRWMTGTGPVEMYSDERLGGQVAGKNLDHPTDSKAGIIVLNATAIDYTDISSGGQVLGAFVLAHELAHPLLTWSRRASGSPPEVAQAQTPAEYARAISRITSDEYRADLIAATLLEALAGDDHEQQVLHAWRANWLAEQHLTSLRDTLSTTVHPGWPDLVMSYRSNQIELGAMWWTLVSQTEQLLTLLAHAEAAATSAGLPLILDGEIGKLPGAQLYVAALWDPVLDSLARQSSLPSVREFAALEQQVTTVTEGAVLNLWDRLGLTFDELDDEPGGFYIHVADPVR